ncbi:MAG: class I SAM-dependent methyltransferase [Chlorobiaceae bacterium]|nr:class I SAM-dependent methyltransferase [Chlorobiaceae bacterium]
MNNFNASEYNEKVMKGHFRKIYPVIAGQIIERTGISSGKCIDLGGGPGMLGISLASISDLQVTIVDPDAECVRLALENSKEQGVQDRVNAVQAPAESIPFDDDSIDLVASRGSIFFWKDQPKGLSEVYRVLRPGGWAYIGGGFGTLALLQEVQAMRADDPDWDRQRRERMSKNPPEHYETILTQLGIDGIVDKSEAGTWIVFRKPLES